MSSMSLPIDIEHYRQIIVILFLRTKKSEREETKFCSHVSRTTLSKQGHVLIRDWR